MAAALACQQATRIITPRPRRAGGITRTVLFVLAFSNVIVLLGVFLRRLLKNRFYALKDEYRLLWGQRIDAVLFGEPLPARRPSLRQAWEREAAEESLLERMTRADPESAAKLQSLFRQWGLFQQRVRLLLWGNPWQQARSALVLAQMGCREALPAIISLLERPYTDVRLAGVNALGIVGVPEAIKPLVGLLPGSSGREARAVLSALLRCARGAPELLVPYLQHPYPLVRLVTAAALAELARPTELPALLAAVTDGEAEVRSRVAQALARTGAREATPGLARLAADPVWFVRLQAAGALGEIGGERAEQLLWKLVEDEEARVRRRAALALHRVSSDPVRLLAELRRRGPDRAALAALVDHLARRGTNWQAISRALSPVAMVREESQELVRELLRARFFSAILYAVETHPEIPLRHELLRLVEEEAPPGVYPRLALLLTSPTLDAESRRRVEKLLARPEARG